MSAVKRWRCPRWKKAIRRINEMHKSKTLTCSTCYALAPCGCQSPSMPVRAKYPQMTPPPAAVMQPREPSFRQRLLMILSPSPMMPTTPSSS
ncbi:hypothetical protein LH460_11200 [Laribacter hongkongensis]|uniref:hypothetical protein n=1 Tax=Laribacter hongkongensis TaxID=168471 RepID=UPI001EFCE37B|nr:hypothetical protein [Laribacter hongkongensis]MCG9115406.1 hypothetical protein [Laribacter hongkongensis]MCG9125225.1 hypothetical protein [Laribacter hongkongensis]